ncbi:MAG: hypothetical protein ACR2MM_13155 [Flavobacteriaceae bacterium]
MKKQVNKLWILVSLMAICSSFSQETKGSDESQTRRELFTKDEILPIKITYSIKEMKTKTNDSTYLNSDLTYQLADGSWQTLDVRLRARGHNRRETCYFTPIKIKIKKSERKGSTFEGDKKLKLVLPCLLQKDKNDKLLKEYMAYKMYQEISPYHFKTRLLDIEFTEIRNKKTKEFKLKGFVIEDIDKVADRFGGKEIKGRVIHPLQQDDRASVQNDFFQFMIGNTDFSNAYQHNEKLIFIDGKKAIPVPYDFDLAGLVNASYAVVSQIGKETLPITSVTERLYRGFKRDMQVYDEVRKDIISRQGAINAAMDEVEQHFEDPQEFSRAKEYISIFYKIIVDDKRYNREIVNRARTK